MINIDDTANHIVYHLPLIGSMQIKVKLDKYH